MMPQEDRRKSKPEFRGKKERREEMKIVVSATQNDIYLWMGFYCHDGRHYWYCCNACCGEGVSSC